MKQPDYLVLVRVDGLLLGVDVHDVREVLGDDSVLPVPLTPALVRGLINLRGEVVTVIDARALLRCADRPAGSRPYQIVVQHRREMLSLEVDEVLEVATIAREQYDLRPDGMQESIRKLANAVVQRDSDLVVVLDVPQLFDHVTARSGNEERSAS